MNKPNGFTLIELMVTIAVIAAVIAAGIPALNRYAESNRTTSLVNLMSGTLALARSEAIKRGIPVIICDSDNATATTPSCNSSANTWSNGWFVYADKNQDNSFDTTHDEVLAVHDKINGGLSVHANDFANTDQVTYQANGALSNSDKGTFVICTKDKNLKNARALLVSPVGLVSMATDTDSTADGIVNDTNNPTKPNVTCP